jgi:hypothetical protein
VETRLKALRLRAPAAIAAVLGLVPAAAATAATPTLIGATFTHTSVQGCHLDDNGIVLHYDRPEMRQLVRSQLAAMHKSGLQTIRILLWNMADISDQDWGVIPSGANKIVEPYRSNLIRFVTDVRRAGFIRLTVHFSPQWTNNPIGEYDATGVTDRWDPSKFEENWRFIAAAHEIIKRYGPASTHFDILSEGPPTHYQPAYIVDRLQSYIATMWSRYVDAFGKNDATVTVIGDLTQPDRLQHLIDALHASGHGFPGWFEVHGPWTSPDLYNVLMSFHETLVANGLTTQPLVIGEASYNNPATADDIARFVRDTGRPVDEVYQWWQRENGGLCFSAPYRGDAYINALTGRRAPAPAPFRLIPAAPLYAVVSPRGQVTFKKQNGTTVKTLDSGTYKITIRDRSTRGGFHLSGPDFDETTGRQFVGKRVWHVDLGTTAPYGSTFTYKSGVRGQRPRHFVLH